MKTTISLLITLLLLKPLCKNVDSSTQAHDINDSLNLEQVCFLATTIFSDIYIYKDTVFVITRNPYYDRKIYTKDLIFFDKQKRKILCDITNWQSDPENRIVSPSFSLNLKDVKIEYEKQPDALRNLLYKNHIKVNLEKTLSWNNTYYFFSNLKDSVNDKVFLYNYSPTENRLRKFEVLSLSASENFKDFFIYDVDKDSYPEFFIIYQSSLDVLRKTVISIGVYSLKN